MHYFLLWFVHPKPNHLDCNESIECFSQSWKTPSVLEGDQPEAWGAAGVEVKAMGEGLGQERMGGSETLRQI